MPVRAHANVVGESSLVAEGSALAREQLSFPESCSCFLLATDYSLPVCGLFPGHPGRVSPAVCAQGRDPVWGFRGFVDDRIAPALPDPAGEAVARGGKGGGGQAHLPGGLAEAVAFAFPTKPPSQLST